MRGMSTFDIQVVETGGYEAAAIVAYFAVVVALVIWVAMKKGGPPRPPA